MVEYALCDCCATSPGIHALLKSPAVSCVTVTEAFVFFAELTMGSKRKADVMDAGSDSQGNTALLGDASDRASHMLKPGQTRVPLEQIGFWEHNRGGLGVNPHHVHEVAHDVHTNKTKLLRYRAVAIVELTDNNDRQRHLDRNRKLCQTDPLMPEFSPLIKYVCLTNTHFVHSMKLMKDGGRTIFDQNCLKIQLAEDDIEGAEIMEKGPMCAIYNGRLLQDFEAAQALAVDDNLNASVGWHEDEGQMYGRVHNMCDRLFPDKKQESKDSKEGNHGGSTEGNNTACKTECKKEYKKACNTEKPEDPMEVVMANLEASGLGACGRSEWKDLVLFRRSIPSLHSKIFMTCQFHHCAGQVRVRAADFGAISKLDPRAPWMKVCVLLHQYIGNLEPKSAIALATFQGRQEKTAKKIPLDVIKELVTEGMFVGRMEKFTVKMMTHYTPGPVDTMSQNKAEHELMMSRGKLFSWIGKHAKAVGETLRNGVVKAASTGQTMTYGARQTMLDGEHKGKFATLEAAYRKELLKKGFYCEKTLPTPLYVPLPSTAKAAATPTPGTAFGADLNPEALTEAHVLERLQITGVNEFVMALFRNVSNTAPEGEDVTVNDGTTVVKAEKTCVNGSLSAVKQEDVEESRGLTDSIGFSLLGEENWQHAKLIKLSLPTATVAVATQGPVPNSEQNDLGWQHFDLCVDDLRPVDAVMKVKEKEVKPVALHPSLLDVISQLDPPEPDYMEVFYSKRLVEHAVVWAHGCSSACFELIRVSTVSETGKSPLVLQVRALGSFKKGTLFLVPAYGTLLLKSVTQAAKLSQTKGSVHKDMLSHVDVLVTSTVRDKRRTHKDKVENQSMVIHSPLLEKKSKNDDQRMENLAPFWAMLHAGGPIATHNMEMDVVSFGDLGFEVRGSGFPKQPKGVSFNVSLPVARNVCHISAGDVLTLPYVAHSRE